MSEISKFLKGFAIQIVKCCVESKQKCNTGLYIESWNSHHVNEPLRYERNAQGDMSSIRCWDLDNSGRCLQHSGPFIRYSDYNCG